MPDPGSTSNERPRAEDESSVRPSVPRKPGDEAPAGAPGTGEAVCSSCGGSGRLDAGACPECEGTGKVTAGIGGG